MIIVLVAIIEKSVPNGTAAQPLGQIQIGVDNMYVLRMALLTGSMLDVLVGKGEASEVFEFSMMTNYDDNIRKISGYVWTRLLQLDYYECGARIGSQYGQEYIKDQIHFQIQSIMDRGMTDAVETIHHNVTDKSALAKEIAVTNISYMYAYRRHTIDAGSVVLSDTELRPIIAGVMNR